MPPVETQQGLEGQSDAQAMEFTPVGGTQKRSIFLFLLSRGLTSTDTLALYWEFILELFTLEYSEK